MSLISLVSGQQPLTYRFPTDRHPVYRLDIQADGKVVELDGGKSDQHVKIGLTLELAASSPASSGVQDVTSTITDSSLVWNGKPYSVFNPKFINSQVPDRKTTIAPNGDIVENHLQRLMLLFEIPFFDLRAFPAYAYAPLELPAGPIGKGTTWSFQREISGHLVPFQASFDSEDSRGVRIKLTCGEKYSDYEDAKGSIVKEPEDADYHVETRVTGGGEAIFSKALSLIESFRFSTHIENKAIDVKTGQTEVRPLDVEIESTLGA